MDTLETYQLSPLKKDYHFFQEDLGAPSCGSLWSSFSCKSWWEEILLGVNDYSRYTWVYFFEYKSETQQTIIDFAKEVECQYGQNILAIRSDNSSEFRKLRLEWFS
jgi:hypothetical protein